MILLNASGTSVMTQEIFPILHLNCVPVQCHDYSHLLLSLLFDFLLVTQRYRNRLATIKSCAVVVMLLK